MHSVSMFIKRVKTNRLENKSNIAFHGYQGQQNNLPILIHELHNPNEHKHVLIIKTNQVISL